MIFMLTLRILFFDANKEADPMAIDALVARLKRGQSPQAQGRLGWLRRLIDDAMGNLVLLRKSIEEFRRRVERFHSTLMVTGNTAMGVGFLGTVAALATLAGGKVDLLIIIGVAVQSTVVGLIIALPGAAFHGLTDAKVNRFLDQIDAVVEALDGRINPPTESSQVPSPAGPSNNGGHRNGQTRPGLSDDRGQIDGLARGGDVTPAEPNEAKRADLVQSVALSPELDAIVMDILEGATPEETTND